MVLESLVNPTEATKPHHILAISFIYTIVAALVSQKIFPNNSSILAISFITILFVPFFQRLFSIEEKKDKRQESINLFVRHKDIMVVFGAFFLGVMLAMTAMYIFLPSAQLFSAQSETLKNFGTGKITDTGEFSRFFVNNTQVLVAMFLLSFAFGAGAVFILAWNASVIALYLGLFIKSVASKGVGTTVAFVYGVPVGLGSIALHGIPEITAYFIAGLAGGLLSVGIIREKFGGKAFGVVLKDSLLLMLLAEFLISVGAYLEAAF